jgi:uncharacterized protein YodC (DUF2158 family)
MEDKFKRGAVVQLKSGGPKMTVRGYNTSDFKREECMIDCDWFHGLEPKSQAFHEDQIFDYRPRASAISYGGERRRDL